MVETSSKDGQMPDNGKTPVPVWTLTTTGSARVPAVLHQAETMTPQRLSELRSALAAFADSPVVTLEAHPMPKQLDRTAGIPLDAVSPLAKHLSDLVARTAQSTGWRNGSGRARRVCAGRS